MEKIDTRTPDITEENIQKLMELFPQVATEVENSEGKLEHAIDFDALRDLLGDVAEGQRERYQFTWPGKREAKAEARRPIDKTMIPCPEKSIDWDTTENLYIEGDNLDALKLLKETYAGTIKLIYIDPPYNTGGDDLTYQDDFTASTDEFISGDYDEQGFRLVKNTSANGRFHSDWCSVIYERLLLAKDLLKPEGAAIVSIDDNEQDNLLKIGKEVFGPNNFVATIPWRKRTAKSDVPFGVSQDYEWILIFAKSNLFKASIDGKERKYIETHDFPGKPWRYHDLTKQTTASERPNSFFTIVNPKTGEEYPANPNRTWAITEETFKSYYDESRIIFPGDYEFLNIKKPVLRYWKSDDETKAGDNFGKVAVSTKLPDYVGMSQDGTKEITQLFDSKVFSFPKPTDLLKFLIKTSTSGTDIILDFYSGSGTTAQAIMQLNVDDGQSRRFILCQIPELLDKETEAGKLGYVNLCELAEDRIKLAGKKIVEDIDQENAQLKLDEAPRTIPDIGFRVLRIGSSNFKDMYASPADEKQDTLNLKIDNIKESRTSEDILFQVLPAFRIPYSAHIEKLDICGKTVFDVNYGQLLACFDADATNDVIEEIARRKPSYAVMRDLSFKDDSAAANFEELFKTFSPDTIRRVI